MENENKSHVFVGGFGTEILTFKLEFDLHLPQNSRLAYKSATEVGDNPSFIDVFDNKLYCVNEVDEFKGQKSGGLSFLKIKDDGELALIHSQYSCGGSPTHLAVNKNWGCCYLANYSSGHFVVPRLKEDGRIAGALYVESFDEGSGVDAERQEGSHPHGVSFKGDVVYVVDLGADKIWQYRHRDNNFEANDPPFTTTPPGSGPRHLVFHPALDLAFLVTELSSEIIVYSWNSSDGALQQLSTHKVVSDATAERCYPCEIAVHPGGKFIYVSNRVCGEILCYKIVGRSIEQVASVSTAGTWPRHFAIHGSGKLLLCADQHKNLIEMFSVAENGSLQKIQELACKNSPSCIVFEN